LLYVVQNFHKNFPYIRTTYKIKILWALHNLHLIYALTNFNYLSFVHDFTTLRTTLLTLTNNTVLPLLLRGLFENLEYLTFQKNLKAPKIFWKTNLEVSLKHKLFTSNSSEVVSCRKYVMTTDHLLYNQYYLPLFVANISLHKKLYRTFFITYFMYILTVWPKLNKHFNFILQFYLVSSNFLLVGYYNKYFFKIYNF